MTICEAIKTSPLNFQSNITFVFGIRIHQKRSISLKAYFLIKSTTKVFLQKKSTRGLVLFLTRSFDGLESKREFVGKIRVGIPTTLFVQKLHKWIRLTLLYFTFIQFHAGFVTYENLPKNVALLKGNGGLR